MSLDELSRKLERGGAMGAFGGSELQLAKEFFESVKGLDVKTEIPDADSFSTTETLLQFIEDEFGKRFRSYLEIKLKRFKIDKIAENRQARHEVERILIAAKNDEVQRGKSILDRLTSSNY